jgi:DNA-binding NtrC family response regulator
MQRDSTVDSDVEHSDRPHGRPVPGLLVLLESGQPAAIPLPLPPQGLELGRGVPAGRFEDDDQVSRAHAKVSLEPRGVRVTDLDSRNGTFVDGARLSAPVLRELPFLVRIGRSVLWAVPDVRPFALAERGAERGRERDEDPVLGGLMSRAFGEIALAAKAGDTLLITGESGSGKELAARAFHAAGRGSDAPFIAVNCAAIPEGLAERLLFGAKRGAYSGAVDADGYVQQAHGGTLFLDEVAELDAQVQAKLLRVLESRQVLALGGTKPQTVEIRICAASHKRLRDQVAAGSFRADLYYRIGRPEVAIAPLRERIDEIPWLAQRALRQVSPELVASAGLIERCALLPWPGNVRELLRELRSAAVAAEAQGSAIVQAEHLAADAGIALAAESTSEPVRERDIDDAAVERALAEHGGNVTAAARALGVHRNQLRRRLDKR